MISKRMTKLTQNSSAVRALFEEGAMLASRFGRENVYDFSIGNPNFPAPEAVKKAITDIVNNEDPVNLHGYMNNAGFPEVRQSIANSLNSRFDTSYDENNIVMSVGAAGGLNVVLKTLIDPGDEVVTISPYFLEYGNYVSNFDGKMVAAPALRDTFQPDPETLRTALTPKTKALIINSPNNPTGAIYSKESIESVAAVLEDKQREFGTAIYLVSDEPYRELAYDGIQVPFLAEYYRNTIVCYSWSKSLSIPGERIGYILIPGSVEDHSLVFSGACVATRVLGYVNAPSLMQKVVARCLDEATDIAAYDENRKLLYQGLKAIGFNPVFPQGAFYMWMKTPVDDKEFVEAAKKYNILIVPGTSFDCPGYVRIAYCVAKKTIEDSMPGFSKLAQEYGLC